ncbi:uncharacterized protein SETTUDRAFT_171206 [Exserohilum turcica Et28A]|uniref:Uncharacterized protein n=1 Tax=Exserohilum turcicum (strain 28A) TaxID=671987 RepID=R0KFJ6_EXST2|nr:uncharacterized protein SETTUDRAFT_171206 [Exserohilum turcica Et28A]EOA86887.1 hypothetical protein SETTUDRAFT_171206 [Exserohilum turcica Et28A]
MAPIHKTPSEEEIASTLGNLQLSPSHPEKPLQKPKSKPVADSWDDEALSGSDTETEDAAAVDTAAVKKSKKSDKGSPQDSLSPLSTTSSRDVPPNPPPPTPASPTQFEYPDNVMYSLGSEGPKSRGPANLDKRPEKTTAVAGRMIAGALGVRAPKRTDEEREYDRAMREKERRRRAEEKEREKKEEDAREARKKAVWDD